MLTSKDVSLRGLCRRSLAGHRSVPKPIRGFGGTGSLLKPCPAVFGRFCTTILNAAVVCTAFAWFLIGGCTVEPELTRSSSFETRALADWDDVDAAVDAACLKGECAVLMASNEGDVRRYQIVTIRDEPGELIVQREGEDGVRIECRIGRFGDDGRARTLADAVRDRLAQLHGVDVAPIR